MAILAAATALSAVGSLFSGVSKYKSAQEQAGLIEAQGDIALRESFRSAAIIREEAKNFMAAQSLQYIGAGVQVAGSALVTIEQTRRYAEAEAKAEETSGRASKAQAEKSADITRNEGRAALIGSLFKAGSSIAKAGD